jgi:uncharacterized protein
MIDSASGTIRRVVAFRLSPGEDLLDGIQSTCEKYKIHNGVILSGIGSLDGVKFFDVTTLPDTKAGYGYSEPVVKTGPTELISASGCICQGQEGEILLHVHCCFADRDGNTFSGHLIRGCSVLMTADIVVGEFDGILMDRRMDDELGVYIVRPQQR